MKSHKILFFLSVLCLTLFVTSCNGFLDEPAHEHDFAVEWSNDNVNHWHSCSDCDEVSDKASHTFDEGLVVQESTVLENGTKKFTCSVCGYEKNEEIPALGHNYSSEWQKDESKHWHLCTDEGCTSTKDEAMHEWNLGKQDPTCEEAGYERSICKVCNYEKVVEIAALGHSFGNLLPQVNATCDEDGLKAHYQCSECDKYFDVDKEEVSFASLILTKTGHNYSDKWSHDATIHWRECSNAGCDEMTDVNIHIFESSVVTAATCDKAGTMNLICSICGYAKTESIAALGHNHSSDWQKDDNKHWHVCLNECGLNGDEAEHNFKIVTVDPSCDKAGSITSICIDCGYERVEEKTALGHKYGVLVAAEVATCDKAGMKAYYQCNECDKYFDTEYKEVEYSSLVIAALGHDYLEEWNKNETNHWHDCLNNCGSFDSLNQHIWNDGEVITAATYEAAGSIKYTCEICLYEKIEEIPQLGHNYAKNWSSDETHHWYECLDEGCAAVSNKNAHNFIVENVEPTCENDGNKKSVCNECGYEKNEKINALGHKYGELIEEVNATCDTDGLKKHYQCSECDKYFDAEYKEVEYSALVIAKLGHNYSTVWSKDEEYHWYDCLNGCNVSTNKSSHEWDDGKVVAMATKDTVGEIAYTCTVCEFVKKDVVPSVDENALTVGQVGGINTDKTFMTYLVRDDDSLDLIGVADQLLTNEDGLLIYVNLLGMSHNRSEYVVAIQGIGNEINWSVYFPNDKTTAIPSDLVALCSASYSGNIYHLSIGYELFDSMVNIEGYSFKDSYYSFTINAKGSGGDTYDFLEYTNVPDAKMSKVYGASLPKYVYATNSWDYIFVSKDNKFISYDDIKKDDPFNYSLEELDAIVSANETLAKEGMTFSENMAQVYINQGAYPTASLVKAEYGVPVFKDRATRVFETFGNDAFMNMFFTQRNCGEVANRYLELTAVTSGYVLLSTTTADTKVNPMWVKVADKTNSPGLLSAKYLYSLYVAYVEAGDTIIVGGTAENPVGDQVLFTNAGSTKITGTVQDKDGAGVSGAIVKLNGIETRTDEEGYFEIELQYRVGYTYDLVISVESYKDLSYVIDETIYSNFDYDFGAIVFADDSLSGDNVLYAGKLGGNKAKAMDVYLAKEETQFTIIGIADEALADTDSVLIYIKLFGMTQWRNEYIFAVQGTGNTISYTKYFAGNKDNNFTDAQIAMCNASYAGKEYRLSISYDLINSFSGLENYSFKDSHYSFTMFIKGAGGEDALTYAMLDNPVYNNPVRSDYKVASATTVINNTRPCQWVYVSKENKFASYDEVMSEDPLNYSLNELDEVVAASSVSHDGYKFSENMAKVNIGESYSNVSLTKVEHGNNIFTDNNNRKFEYFCNEALVGMYYSKKPGSTAGKASWYFEATAETSGYVLLATLKSDTAVNSMWTKVVEKSNAHGLLDNEEFYSLYVAWVNVGDTIIVGGTAAAPVGQQLLFTLANSK